MLEHVHQKPHLKDCALAAVAMVANVSYEEAAAKTTAPLATRGLTQAETIALLRTLTQTDWRCDFSGLQLLDRLDRPENVGSANEPVVVVIRKPWHPKVSHAVVLCGKWVHDPSFPTRFHQSAYPRRHWRTVCIYRPTPLGSLGPARMKNWAAKNLPLEQDSWTPILEAAEPDGRCVICHKPLRRDPWLSLKDAPCPHCGSTIQFENVPRLAPEWRETKDRWQPFHSWVTEFTSLCRSDVSQEKLFTEFIQGLTRTMCAVAGMIWIVNGRRLRPQYGVGFEFTGLYENPRDRRRHAILLKQVLASGTPTIVPPPTSPGRSGDNPTGWLLLFVPLKYGEMTKAIVEIFYWPVLEPTWHQYYMQALRQISDLACQSPVFQSLRRKPWWVFWEWSTKAGTAP